MDAEPVDMRTLCRIALFALLAGCSAGASLPPAAHAPAAFARGAGPARDPSSQTLTVSVFNPKASVGQIRGLQYAYSQGSKTVIGAVPLAPSKSKDCKKNADGSVACTLEVSIPPGTYLTSFSTYNLAPVKGAIPKNAILIGSAAGVPVTVSPTGGTLNLSLGLETIEQLRLSIPIGAAIGSAFSGVSLYLLATDAKGRYIVGQFDNPVTVTDSDTSGATKVKTTGKPAPPAGKLLKSADLAKFSYTGAGIPAVTLTASADGVTPAKAIFKPLPIIDSVMNDGGTVGYLEQVTLTGHFIANGTTIVLDGTGVTIGKVTTTATQVTATFAFGVAGVGTHNLSVKVTGGATSNSFSYNVSAVPTHTVTKATDSSPGMVPGLCPAGVAGELRYALCHYTIGDAIDFDTKKMCNNAYPCTITLAAPLPPIGNGVTIDGGTLGHVAIDGNGQNRIFFVESSSVSLFNLMVQDGDAVGGAGGYGAGAGGGGAGLGAGLFVDSAQAIVNVVNDEFVGLTVNGGYGGTAYSPGPHMTGRRPHVTLLYGGGGGGGMGLAGNGGSGDGSSAGGGGGGGGILGAGIDASGLTGGNGGIGDGGGGGAGGTTGTQPSAGTPGMSYFLYSTGQNGSQGSCGAGGNGGAGGIGGGGGGGGGAPSVGCASTNPSAGSGAVGGFGGGGGGAGYSGNGPANGANGGAGGGGGGAPGSGTAGTGGSLGTVHGGNGDATDGDGGGGAAAGPAIFVNAGTLVTMLSTAGGLAAYPGTAHTGGHATNGTANAIATYNYAGTVNGSTKTGPLAGALGKAPSSDVERAMRLQRNRARKPAAPKPPR